MYASQSAVLRSGYWSNGKSEGDSEEGKESVFKALNYFVPISLFFPYFFFFFLWPCRVIHGILVPLLLLFVCSSVVHATPWTTACQAPLSMELSW